MKRGGWASVVVVGALALAGCGAKGSSPTAATDTTVAGGRPGTTATAGSSGGTPTGPATTGASTGPASGCAAGVGLPTGKWTGPVGADVSASATGPYGSATKVAAGGGTISMTVTGRTVTSGTASFNASSTTTTKGVRGSSVI